MSIKSDKWIRRMAQEHGLIEPFAPRQVRENEGGRIISYGTSSYGYDVRCAREFKIFTNINSTIVDPKQFDEKSFVDVAADVCIIPPNSFALARTVEYFRIPRNVLTVCLGKCVTGDTRVVDADTGAYVPITEMRWGKKTLALDGSRLRSARVSDFIPQGVREVFELRTRAGLRVRATANHPFRMLDRWTPLSELRAGDRVAVAREIPVFGRTPLPDWEATLLGLMISEGQCNTPGHSPTYTTADPAMVKLLEQAVAESGMESNSANLWPKAHGLNVRDADKFVPHCVFMAPEPSVRLFLQALFSGEARLYHSDEGLSLEYYSNSRRLIEDVHHLLLRFAVFSRIQDRITAVGTRAWRVTITDKQEIQRFAARIGFTADSLQQRVLDEEVPPEMLHAAGRAGGTSPGRLNIGATNTNSAPFADGPFWDVVDKIERAGEEEVFDISVPGLHNFVANDMIVHNSTYARCFSADTRVALVDGTSSTLEEMAVGHANGELYWGYSVGANGRVIVTLLDAPRFIGRDSLIEITLDNGQTVRATPDHQFVRRDGRMAPAMELRPSDSLMPLYRDLRRGYEHVYQPINGHLLPTHRLADEWNVRNGLYEDAPGTHRHHIDVIPRLSGRPGLNHKIAAIRELPGDHDVYCLTVPEAGNFALEAGIFVKNCGIIVNVTPLEPEWEGHVTLEFSNTTPLPAKIYANEGVAQMLFFESDEVCETSYADRGGKYQGQRGVTLPKA